MRVISPHVIPPHANALHLWQVFKVERKKNKKEEQTIVYYLDVMCSVYGDTALKGVMDGVVF